MEARFRSPPETPRTLSLPMGVSRAFTKPNSAIHASTKAIFSTSVTVEGKKKVAASVNVSTTVKCAYRLSSCKTYAELARNFASSRVWPLILTLPDKLDTEDEPVGTLAANKFSRLVLPQPVGPIIANNSPDCVFPETFRKMSFFFITVRHGLLFNVSFTSILKLIFVHSKQTFSSC